MHAVLNIPGFWIYQVSEYAGFTQDSEYAWIIPEYAWKCLIMLEYTWVCLNQPEGLFFHVFFVIPCLLEHVVTYFKEVCSLKERKAIFLKTQNLIFFFSSWKVWFVFCFKVNIFASKISNLLIPFRTEGTRCHESWYTIIKEQKNMCNQGDICNDCSLCIQSLFDWG